MRHGKIPPNGYALVTGASSGIGYEIARILASMGYDLVIVSNEKKALAEIKRDIEKNRRVSVEAVCIDLARQDSASSLHKICRKKRLSVDILVNNAGIFFFGEAVDANPARAIGLLNLHVITHSLMCTLFGRDMKERRRGYILNIASIAGYRDFPGISYYGASKRYLRSFSKSLRCEMKEYNVSVTCVCPGATATNLYGTANINMKLALKTRIMTTPGNVAEKAVNAMFKGKGSVIPGILNRMMVGIACMIPQSVIDFIKRRFDIMGASDKYM